jgi:MOB kinase activator 1
MSGFITTMFVQPAAHASPSSPQYPAKPRPLQPIFTFVQSQSCTNLGMHLLDEAEQGKGKGVWTKPSAGRFEAFTPTKPQLVYKNPLQRIGEALRAPQAGYSAMSPVLEASSSCTSFQLQLDEQTPARAFPNYSYKLLPGGRGSPIFLNGKATGTYLLSSFSSNPRTRAPFKPQKSGRGTSSWQLKQYAEATLGSGSLRKAVKLPEGEDKDEWLAVNGANCFGFV